MESYAAMNDNHFLTARRHPDLSEEGVCRRDEFQRDRDRVMHSRAFRRMMHKTQIFNANMGDHYRNRLTHTLEVSQIARSIGKTLGLNDELIEAIALGHDLGHTPYGHIGERTLNNLLMDQVVDEIAPIHQGFKHNFQSMRLVDELESRCSAYSGLNLTLAVREGILKHTSTTKNGEIINYPEADYTNIDLLRPSFTFEGQIVAIADEVAQCTHDLEDGVRSRIIGFDSIIGNDLVKRVIDAYSIPVNSNTKTPAYDTRNLIIKNMVGFLIKDICAASRVCIEDYMQKYGPSFRSAADCINEKCIQFSSDVDAARKTLYNMITTKVICSEQISASDAKSEYIIKQLFKAYYVHPKQLPDYVLDKYCNRKGIKFDRVALSDKTIIQDPAFIRTICDHISGMTDQFASRDYFRLYVPDHI